MKISIKREGGKFEIKGPYSYELKSDEIELPALRKMISAR